MSGWNMSRSTPYDWKCASPAFWPSTVISTFGDAADESPTAQGLPVVLPVPLLWDWPVTVSASLSFTVQVARSGAPCSENIVYLTDSDSITHLNVGTVLPQVTTHRCGRRRVSSALPGSSTEAIVL